MESSATKRAKEAEKAASEAEKRALFLEKQLQTAKKEADNMEITDLRRKETNLSGRLLEEQMKHAQLIDDHEKEKMRASESERQLVQAEKKLSSLQASKQGFETHLIMNCLMLHYKYKIDQSISLL